MTYQERKEAARAEAINWMQIASELSLSYSDLIALQSYFAHLARRYGLTKEFHENGLI